MMSDASSGGVLSNVLRTASTMLATGSAIPVQTWFALIVRFLGRPLIKSRPRISMVSGLSTNMAVPNVILICSAVRSPISRLNVLRI